MNLKNSEDRAESVENLRGSIVRRKKNRSAEHKRIRSSSGSYNVLPCPIRREARYIKPGWLLDNPVERRKETMRLSIALSLNELCPDSTFPPEDGTRRGARSFINKRKEGGRKT